MNQKAGSKDDTPADQKLVDSPVVGFNARREPVTDLAPDKPPRPDSPTVKAVKKGAKWGMIAGFVVAQMVISSKSISTPFGPIYNGSLALAYGVWIGLGTAIGAGFGWLSVQRIGDDDDPPPPLDRL